MNLPKDPEPTMKEILEILASTQSRLDELSATRDPNPSGLSSNLSILQATDTGDDDSGFSEELDELYGDSGSTGVEDLEPEVPPEPAERELDEEFEILSESMLDDGILSWTIEGVLDANGEPLTSYKGAPPRLVVSDADGELVGEMVLAAPTARDMLKVLEGVDRVYRGVPVIKPRRNPAQLLQAFGEYFKEKPVKGSLLGLLILSIVYSFIYGLINVGW